MTARTTAACTLVALGLLSVSCAPFSPRLQPVAPTREFTSRILIGGRPLDLHLARPLAAPVAPVAPMTSPPLVLYASGDGGWFGAAVDMFHIIAADGYPVVGISSRSFMKLAAQRAPLRPETLTSDYVAILAQARQALGLPADGPVVLTGWSRGASFAVIAAAQPTVRPSVRGVVAIGLTAAEDLRVDGDGDEDDDGPGDDATSPSPEPPTARGLDTYQLLRRLSPVRSAVIQATHDNYLPAAQARLLFGADAATRRFFAVDARNHRFSGGRAAFAAALTDALHWAAD